MNIFPSTHAAAAAAVAPLSASAHALEALSREIVFIKMLMKILWRSFLSLFLVVHMRRIIQEA
jgi:hypothetical protein